MDRLLGSGKLNVPSAGVFGVVPLPESGNTVGREEVLAEYGGDDGLRHEDPNAFLIEGDGGTARRDCCCSLLRAKRNIGILGPKEEIGDDPALSVVDRIVLDSS